MNSAEDREYRRSVGSKFAAVFNIIEHKNLEEKRKAVRKLKVHAFTRVAAVKHASRPDVDNTDVSGTAVVEHVVYQ